VSELARASRIAAVVAAAALLLPFLALPGAGARAARVKADSVVITVDDITPTVLPTDAALHPLAVTLTIENRSANDLTGLTIEGERGEPFTTQAQLDQVVKHVAAPAGSVVPIRPTQPLRLDLLAGETQQVVFRSTTSTAQEAGLCNCTNADRPALAYPLYFTAHQTTAAGVDQSFGLAATVVSAFSHAPAPVHVGWVWPLIDQPHLLNDTAVGTGGPVFTDDFLAASVASGGRLDRALTVAEAVARDPAKPPLTLAIDPELLEELQIMASGPYQVLAGTNGRSTDKYVRGRGGALASAWLQRLRNLLNSAPQLQVQLTAYADPDVEALEANGLTWSMSLPAGMKARVEAALGRSAPASTLAWPVGGAVSRRTLTTLAGQGIGTVLLNAGAVSPKTPAGAVRPGLARLSAAGSDVVAGLLDPTLQRYVSQSLTAGSVRPGALPLLMGELAIRAVQEPTVEHTAVLAPSRWVEPDVDAAVHLIEATSTSPVTTPLAVTDAGTGELLPTRTSRLARVPASARTLPSGSLAAVQQVTGARPTLTAILTPAKPATISAGAQAMLDQLPLEAQRVASAAWGADGNERAAAVFAHRLATFVDGLSHSVTIVTPSSGTYTLASENSPLPITVRNALPWPVTVRTDVAAVNGLLGFTATQKTATVGANQKATFHVATKIERTGRIRVTAALYTPDGSRRIGDPVEMTVRSTALGVVGVIITIGAGAVLVLALLIRIGRRLGRRWSRNGRNGPRWDPDAPDAARTFAEKMREEERQAAEHAPAERSP